MAEAASVTVYSTPTCPWCDRAKAYLAANGVPFRDVDVSRDQQAAMEMVRLSGQQGVPVTVADGEVILGFDQARLAKIAAKFAGPKRPPLGILAADAEEYLTKHPELAEKVPAGTKGVYVGKIRPQTVAERAGLQPGDILTSFAGKRIRSMAQLDQMSRR
ncbi:MAG: Uxx-star family glutaredoxin-like (seleno)protein [Thermomicrobiales bacterium]